MKTQICTKCHIEKDISSFHKKARAKSGLCPYCKTCDNKRRRKQYYENRERSLKTLRGCHLKRAYGISIEEYEQMNKLQNGKCAICDNACTSGMRLAVDHDHNTGEIRALLCGTCNRALGTYTKIINDARYLRYITAHAVTG